MTMTNDDGISVKLNFDPGHPVVKRVGIILVAIGVLVFAGTLSTLPRLLAPPTGYPVNAKIVSISTVHWQESSTTGNGTTRHTSITDCYGSEYRLRFVADGRDQDATLRSADGCHFSEATAIKSRQGHKPGGTAKVLYETGKEGVKWPGIRANMMPLVMGVCISLALVILGGATLYASRAPTREQRESRFKRTGCVGCLLVAALPVVGLLLVFAVLLLFY